MPTNTQPAELSDIVGAVRRHWFLVVVISLLGLVLGLLAIFVIPVSYTSTASVAVNPMNANPLGSSSDSTHAVNMATEEQLAPIAPCGLGGCLPTQPPAHARRADRDRRHHGPDAARVLGPGH